MDQWDQDVVDEEVEGFFEFETNGLGSFQFIYVRGCIDWRESTHDDSPSIEFSWEGADECDPASGRGWVRLSEEGIEGTIYFHRGDESAFRAAPKTLKSPRS